MHKRIKISVYVLLVLVSVVCLWGYLEFSKPADIDISKNEYVEKVAIEELIAMFQNNETEANTAFIEKIIEVRGVIKDITFLNDRHTILLNSKGFSKNYVMCDMAPLGDTRIDQLTIGDTVTLKGVCKGYLLDVIMLNCIPIDEDYKK